MTRGVVVNGQEKETFAAAQWFEMESLVFSLYHWLPKTRALTPELWSPCLHHWLQKNWEGTKSHRSWWDARWDTWHLSLSFLVMKWGGHFYLPDNAANKYGFKGRSEAWFRSWWYDVGAVGRSSSQLPHLEHEADNTSGIEWLGWFHAGVLDLSTVDILGQIILCCGGWGLSCAFEDI